MMTDVNDNEIKIDTAPTIGERLRLAREAKKLTINDVSTELRLTKHVIEHIENERWVELHGRAYARGYFSNYVKFLGLPEDELLAAFSIEYKISEPSLVMTDQKDNMHNKKSHWLSVFLVILLSVLAWFAYQQWQAAQNTTDQSSSSLSTGISENTAGVKDTIVEKDEGVRSLTQQEINHVEQQIITDAPQQFDSQPNSDVSEVISELELSDIPVEELLSTESNQVANIGATVELRFNNDCWVEVKDANDNVLLNKMMTENDSIILNGPSPLSVMLGRASAVEVKFNDEIFDTSPYTQRDVARFTLGAEF